MRLSLLLLIATACSCATGTAPPEPPQRPYGGEVIARNGDGRVLCEDISQLADAASAALAIDAYSTLAGQRLGFVRDKNVEVWLVPNHPRKGSTYPEFIALRPSPEVMAYVDLVLTHEFVHWHAHGTVMATNLPRLMREGVACRIAVDLTYRWKQDRETLHEGLVEAAQERGDLTRLFSFLGLSSDEFSMLSEVDSRDGSALGFVLVSRIGVDVLRVAAEQGPVSPDAILKMAGVASDGSGL